MCCVIKWWELARLILDANEIVMMPFGSEGEPYENKACFYGM
jgi:hypothetical protein